MRRKTLKNTGVYSTLSEYVRGVVALFLHRFFCFFNSNMKNTGNAARSTKIEFRKKTTFNGCPTSIKICYILIFLGSFTGIQPSAKIAWSQSPRVTTQQKSNFTRAQTQYLKGNYSTAEASYKKILLKGKINRKFAAKIQRQIGICRFMLGHAAEAKIIFKKALSLNPRLTLVRNEVLDESVLGIFESARTSTIGRKHASSKRSRTLRSNNAPSQRRKSLRSTSSRTTGATKSRASTSLQIHSNAKNAVVLIEGIMAGRAGSVIEADPGKTEVSVSAPGFQLRFRNVLIKPNRKTIIRINLAKKIKKVDLVKKAKKIKQARRSRSNDLPAKTPIPLRISQRKKSRIRSPSSSSSRTRSQRQARKSSSRQPGMFDDPEPQFQQPQSGRNLTREFDVDTAGRYSPTPRQPQGPIVQRPIYRQPAPVYQQPAPVYQQPAPVYQQPAPVYQQPAPVYSAPAPSYQPAAPYPSPQYSPPAPRASRNFSRSSRSRRKRSKKSRNKSPNIAVSFLPLGGGQFFQDKPILGALFAATQVGGLYLWYSKNAEADQSIATSEAFLATRQEEEDTLAGEAQVQFSAESDDYFNKSTVYVDGITQQSTYGLIGVGAGYAASVLEALLNPPKQKSRKKPRRRFSEITTRNGRKYVAFKPQTRRSRVHIKLAQNETIGTIEQFDTEQRLIPTSLNISLTPWVLINSYASLIGENTRRIEHSRLQSQREITPGLQLKFDLRY